MTAIAAQPADVDVVVLNLYEHELLTLDIARYSSHMKMLDRSAACEFSSIGD